MMITAALFAFCVVVIQGAPNAERSVVAEVEVRHSARDCSTADAVECRQWKSFGWCNVEVYSRHCARECGYCKKEMANKVEVVAEVEERHSARDCNAADAPECPKWKEFGWCNVEVYSRHCARECGFCKKEMANEVEVVAEVEERHSARDCNAADAPECPKWKEFGWCNVEVYSRHCARECGFCKKEMEILELEKRD